ncbi:JmjC domain-containing protein [Halomonas binhaiensis]|uniref:JmjC domain-containing protein n=1 Tax=Halomonas binhaiensis TaxID=2562282 RepID=A0A5C1NLL1_9GAMM|nr:cupin domain-containing protein [Halomonas binhaiensis]QEM83611.1 hypothetical protein E4T21_20115 [Halomonas binhaiensis]
MNIYNNVYHALHDLKSRKSTHGKLQELPFLFGFKEVGEILNSPITRSIQIRVVQNGRLVPRKDYTRSYSLGRDTIHDALDNDRIVDLIINGATVAIDSLEYLSSDIQSICKKMSEIFGISATATAYITPPHRPGLMPHTDEEEILVIQTSGSKNWRYSPPSDDIAYSEIVGNDILSNSTSVMLKKGYTLCLPSGAPHEANTGYEASIHLTFSVEKERYSDLIKSIIEIEEKNRNPLLTTQFSHVEEVNRIKLRKALIKIYNSIDDHEIGTGDVKKDHCYTSWDNLQGKEIKINLLEDIHMTESSERLIIESNSMPGRIILTRDVKAFLEELKEKKYKLLNEKNKGHIGKLLFVLSGYNVIKIEIA